MLYLFALAIISCIALIVYSVYSMVRDNIEYNRKRNRAFDLADLYYDIMGCEIVSEDEIDTNPDACIETLESAVNTKPLYTEARPAFLKTPGGIVEGILEDNVFYYEGRRLHIMDGAYGHSLFLDKIIAEKAA